MSHTLKNKNLEIHIDLPNENYNFSRFDWTGKITKISFQNDVISTNEKLDSENENFFGKGFYNEFGIDNALGFEEAKIGEWFHKIGIGLLKKRADQYFFYEKYEIKPLNFNITKEKDRILFKCKSPSVNGYSYELIKEIVLQKNGFRINYKLGNTGNKKIITNEYVHNFIAFNNELMSKNYELKFPFKLYSKTFDENINLEKKIEIKENTITFNNTPKEQFFMSNLSGNKKIKGSWELINTNCNIGIRETSSFDTNKINLWGWKHVISPELFFDININPGELVKWSRVYDVFKVK